MHFPFGSNLSDYEPVQRRAISGGRGREAGHTSIVIPLMRQRN
jgi:hypothetical protein